jgi:4'-phosphopantetheinyl transferase
MRIISRLRAAACCRPFTRTCKLDSLPKMDPRPASRPEVIMASPARGVPTTIDSSKSFSLASREVHVWSTWLHLPERRVLSLARSLSAEEHMRADSFYFQEQRRRFIVARGFLRSILAGYLNISRDQVEFSYGKYGKPMLDSRVFRSNLRFNLAHSAALAVCAVIYDQDIGVDAEQVRTLSEAGAIARTVFSAAEQATLRSLPPTQRDQAFLNCWTRKEAYLKAIGDGLASPLDGVHVTLRPGEPARLLRINGDDSTHWTLRDLTPAAGYVGALAVRGEIGCIEVRRWGYADDMS